ncbi:MAG: hypothetical protein M2R45_00194 [Verrucomicrobia subdivision 3 bacterium]|nr:hypothetical protein [Limisphaerales bacterium]MCS1412347.1 hypothetical protein [Limisphaerales bacterium]
MLRRCHNYIYVKSGSPEGGSISRTAKAAFLQGVGKECKSIAGQCSLLKKRIIPLFEEVKVRYPYIFGTGDYIKLNRCVLAYIVSELQWYSLLNMQTDVKGQAYEELMGANLQGDQGSRPSHRETSAT